MRQRFVLAVLGTLVACPGLGAPSVQIRGAAARVVVIPEARSDIAVTVIRASPKLPLKVRSSGGQVFVNGDVRHRVHGCQGAGGRRSVGVWGRGVIAYEELPQLLIRTPLDARISVGEAVFGDIGRSHSLDLTNQGCGDWTVANVAGRLRLNEVGSGHARTGAAASADLSVAGSGVIATRAIGGPVRAMSSGSGNISVASVFGPLDVRIAGSGNVRVAAGKAPTMTASIAGSGDASFGGATRNLRASIAGSGDVSVARVTGTVSKRTFGRGRVTVGR